MSLSPRRVAGIWLNRSCSSGGAFPKRAVRRLDDSGACRSEGLVAGEHVPDGLGEPAGEVDLGDLGAALAAEPALGVLVALGVVGVLAGVQGGLEQRPAQVLGAVLGDRAAGVDCAGLAHARAQSGVAAQLRRRGKRAMSPISEAIV